MNQVWPDGKAKRRGTAPKTIITVKQLRGASMVAVWPTNGNYAVTTNRNHWPLIISTIIFFFFNYREFDKKWKKIKTNTVSKFYEIIRRREVSGSVDRPTARKRIPVSFGPGLPTHEMGRTIMKAIRRGPLTSAMDYDDDLTRLNLPPFFFLILRTTVCVLANSVDVYQSWFHFVRL